MTERTFFRLSLFAIGLALFIFCIAYAGDKKHKKPVVELQHDFVKYKQATLDFLDEHAEEHSTCLLLKLRPTIEYMSFLFSDAKGEYRMWVYPEFKSYDKEHPARVFVDVSSKWTVEWAVRDILHEAFHLTVDKKGYYICGKDRVRNPFSRSVPVCALFGKTVYDSEDLTRAIEAHLEEYNYWKQYQ